MAGGRRAQRAFGVTRTRLLTYWVRDREKGERFPIEWFVEKQTRRTAEFYAMHDRGVIAPAMQADFNVTYEEGKPTGALPGRLVRGPQPSPSA
jgi:N-acyl-D-aspartate/D-glutamate deacylase